jgi:tRNA(adenine34) deaminase
MSLVNRFDEPMRLALSEAAKAVEISQDVPVGAVLIDGLGQVVAVGRNERELTGDPTAHAELVAIRAASEGTGDWRLEDFTLVVTLEPCVMCAGAIVAARIGRVVFGAFDERVGAGGSLYDLLRDRRLGTPIEVIGAVLADESTALLRQFFESRRTSGSK